MAQWHLPRTHAGEGHRLGDPREAELKRCLAGGKVLTGVLGAGKRDLKSSPLAEHHLILLLHVWSQQPTAGACVLSRVKMWACSPWRRPCPVGRNMGTCTFRAAQVRGEGWHLPCRSQCSPTHEITTCVSEPRSAFDQRFGEKTGNVAHHRTAAPRQPAMWP